MDAIHTRIHTTESGLGSLGWECTNLRFQALGNFPESGVGEPREQGTFVSADYLTSAFEALSAVDAAAPITVCALEDADANQRTQRAILHHR